MKAKDIKVGFQYTAELDAKGERAPVTVTNVFKRRETRMSGRGGMPSVWYVTNTFAEVRDSNWVKSIVLVRHIYPAGTHHTAEYQHCQGCDSDACTAGAVKRSDAADSAGFAEPGGVTVDEFLAICASEHPCTHAVAGTCDYC